MHSVQIPPRSEPTNNVLRQTALKKVCMVGAHSVGKSSLVRRFVDNMFHDDYQKTLGVRIDKTNVPLVTTNVSCVIWDIHGEEPDRPVIPAYYRGMSGFLLFVDGTRRSTLTIAYELADRINESVGAVPFVLVLSKSDLKQSWEIAPHEIVPLSSRSCITVETSAKTGAGVQTAFKELAQAITTTTDVNESLATT